MKNKKFCIKCGEEITKDSIFCSKCGTKAPEIKEEIQNSSSSITLQNKSKIGVALIITILVGIAGAYFLLMPHYEWDKYNELIDKGNFEIYEGNRIREEYTDKLDEWNNKWDKIYWQTGSSYVQENNLKILRDYDNAIDNLNPLLVESSRHYGNAEIYIKEIKTLNLPDWTYEYIDLRIQSLQKRKQALSKEIEVDSKRKIVRDFVIAYVDGQIDGLKFSEEIKKGLINTNLYNFDKAQINIKNSQKYLNSWIYDWNNAYKKIPINSLKSNINTLQCMDSSMDYMIKGLDALNNRNYSVATNYFEQGTSKMSLCTKTVRSSEDVDLDLSLWIEKNIEPLQKQADKLYEESTKLEEQSNKIWEQNHTK